MTTMNHHDARGPEETMHHLPPVVPMLRAGGETLPLSARHAELLARAEEPGFGADDNSAIIEVFRAMQESSSRNEK